MKVAERLPQRLGPLLGAEIRHTEIGYRLKDMDRWYTVRTEFDDGSAWLAFDSETRTHYWYAESFEDDILVGSYHAMKRVASLFDGTTERLSARCRV